MMSNRLRWMPSCITLIAVAFASIMTYIYGYEQKTALIIIIVVLLIFFFLSTVLQSLIHSFEMANEKAKKEEEAEKGKVVEKDGEKDTENSEGAQNGSGEEKTVGNTKQETGIEE